MRMLRTYYARTTHHLAMLVYMHTTCSMHSLSNHSGAVAADVGSKGIELKYCCHLVVVVVSVWWWWWWWCVCVRVVVRFVLIYHFWCSSVAATDPPSTAPITALSTVFLSHVVFSSLNLSNSHSEKGVWDVASFLLSFSSRSNVNAVDNGLSDFASNGNHTGSYSYA